MTVSMLFALVLLFPCFDELGKGNAAKPNSISSHAADTTDEFRQHSSYNAPGYCGVVCLYALAEMFEKKTSLLDFIEAKYLTSPFGSSAKDLLLAAEDNGLDSELVGGLSVGNISKLKVPAILHVRPRGYDEFVHWVAYLGLTEDRGFRIFDPNHGFEIMSGDDLASRFDGVAILVANDQTSIAAAKQSLFFNRAMYAAILGLAFCAISQLVAFIFNSCQNKLYVVLSSFLAAYVFAFGYHSFAPGGLLKDSTGVVRRLAESSTISFEEIGTDELRLALTERLNEIALVDARFQKSFEAGTIANAVHYPLDINESLERQLLDKLSNYSEIVVFCESSSCTYSDKIAKRIVNDGSRNVIVYRAGYREWNNDEK